MATCWQPAIFYSLVVGMEKDWNLLSFIYKWAMSARFLDESALFQLDFIDGFVCMFYIFVDF